MSLPRDYEPQVASRLSSIQLLDGLQARANILLTEFRAYQSYLRDCKKQNEVELRGFKRGVESEVRSLQSLHSKAVANDATSYDECEDQDQIPHELHALRSSNLPFYEAVWDVAKSCQGIVAMGKKWYPGHTPSRGNKPTIPGHVSPRKGHLVDIVAHNGLEWIKVSTITERRLLFEMAKEGWETYGDFSDRESASDDDTTRESAAGSNKLALIRSSEGLVEASRSVRVKFQHPSVRFVLPNIREGLIDDVDAFVAALRGTGATVQCATVSGVKIGVNDQERSTSNSLLQLAKMLPFSGTPPLTGTINIDCTILLALISDISHFRGDQLSPTSHTLKGSYHKSIVAQTEAEETQPMLPTEIYPLLQGRLLSCTSHAAQRMREIVCCMGTVTERIRGGVVLGESEYEGKPPHELRDTLEKYSNHAVPVDLRLPIQIITFDVPSAINRGIHPQNQIGNSTTFPSAIAARMALQMNMSPVNSSVFLYGWHEGIVTLTSNGVVASGLLRTIDRLLDEDEVTGVKSRDEAQPFVGPQIHICRIARSLVGKEKN